MDTCQQKGLIPEPEGANNVIVLYEIPGCVVTRYPDSTVVKRSVRVTHGERLALELAAQLELPVPHVHEAQVEAEAGGFIRMDFVDGERLDLVWPNMTTQEKDSICQQLREILTKMRSLPWETGLIGSCSGGPAQDCRQYSVYSDGPYKDEATFTKSFYFDLVKSTPALIRSALFQLHDNHRIVFSHGDLAQHNILVKDGQIKGLIDWEFAGWYPEHWDYIKFFDRPCEYSDWVDRASLIFPQIYEKELAYHQGIVRWQRP